MKQSVLLLCLLPPFVHAYGFLGHIIAASLTWDLLPKDTRKCIGIDSREKFVKLACRPDQIKHREGMEWAMLLHFYNTKDNPPSYCQASFPIIPNGKNLISAAYNYTTRVQRGIEEVGRPDPIDLSFFLHFMVDLHQPLHLSSKRWGGNKFRVLFESQRLPLHAIWDTHIIRRFWRIHRKSGKLPNLLHRRVIRLLKTQPKRAFCDTSDGVERCISDWASDTNKVNCKVVWGKHLNQLKDLSGEYYQVSKDSIINLIVLSALRVSLLLQSFCHQL